jgi:hypothetical protein
MVEVVTYQVTCRRCGQPILTAPRIFGPEVHALIEHLRTAHAEVDELPSLGVLLESFEVQRRDGPS